MAFTFDPIFAADPSNPTNVASNAAITIYNPNDPGKAPVTITDVSDSPLANPITVNKNGFGPAFKHATLDRLAWSGGGFTGYFTSYEGIKNEAIAARQAAETAGTNAAAAATAGVAPVVADAEVAAANAAAAQSAAAASANAAAQSAALVGAPADTAIATAINATGSETKAALNSAFAPVLGSSAYVPRTSQRVIVIGDSIDQGADVGSTFFGGSWASQLAVRTNQKFHLVRNSAIGGQTTTQIAARFQADVLAHKPGIVVIGGSTNDRNGNMAGGVAQTKANFIDMAARAKAAGAHVVVRTAPPTDVAGGGTLNTVALNRAAVDNFNAWLKIWARENLIPVIDLHKHWVDQTTGGWKSGYSTDGIHPTPAALLIAVEGIKAELPTLFNGSVDLLMSNADASSLSVNPLLITDSNIDNIPDQWYFPDFTAITLSNAAAGKWVEINTTTAAKWAYAAKSATGLVSPGDVVSLAGKVKTTAAVGATIQIQNQSNASVATPMNNWVGEITDGTFYMEYTIPEGVTQLQPAINASATGGKVSVSQLTLRNRTKLGLV